jgi:S-adenosylmethionine synthetase
VQGSISKARERRRDMSQEENQPVSEDEVEGHMFADQPAVVTDQVADQVADAVADAQADEEPEVEGHAAQVADQIADQIADQVAD